MALTFTHKVSLDATSSAVSYATTTGGSAGSFTPTANTLLIVTVSGDGTGGGTPNTGPATGVSGNGVTYTKIEDLDFTTVADGNLSVWAGFSGASPSAGVTTAVFGMSATNRAGCAIHVCEVGGAYVSGTLGQAIVQYPENSGTGTSSSVTLSAAAHANNRPYCAIVHQANETTTEEWTQLLDSGHGSPARNLATMANASAFDTSATASWTTSSAWLSIALEIAEASSISAGAEAAGTIPLGF